MNDEPSGRHASPAPLLQLLEGQARMLNAQKTAQAVRASGAQMSAPRPALATRVAGMLPAAPALAPVNRARSAWTSRKLAQQIVAMAIGTGGVESTRTQHPLPIVFVSAEVGAHAQTQEAPKLRGSAASRLQHAAEAL